MQSDVNSEYGNPGVAPRNVIDGSVWYRAQRERGLLRYLIIGIILGFLVVAGPYQVLSQGVQLVHVDVQVVAHGYRVSKLTGHVVVNDKNERIGRINDFVIDHDDPHSLFTVIQVGGFLGIRSRLVAVPYHSLTISHAGNRIELPGASKDQLEKLTAFRYGA